MSQGSNRGGCRGCGRACTPCCSGRDLDPPATPRLFQVLPEFVLNARAKVLRKVADGRTTLGQGRSAWSTSQIRRDLTAHLDAQLVFVMLIAPDVSCHIERRLRDASAPPCSVRRLVRRLEADVKVGCMRTHRVLSPTQLQPHHSRRRVLLCELAQLSVISRRPGLAMVTRSFRHVMPLRVGRGESTRPFFTSRCPFWALLSAVRYRGPTSAPTCQAPVVGSPGDAGFSVSPSWSSPSRISRM